MALSAHPTIFALATAPGRAGVAVIRVSGPAARMALAQLCAPKPLPDPRRAVMRDIRDPATKEIVDRALVLWFKGPESFTGEDVVEFHLHGGRAVVNRVTEVLQGMPDFRLAEPGEFSRRAFENNKMDLTEAEAIADLVAAETEAQRRQALRQMQGDLGKLYAGWRERLKRALAHMEATIDFSEEELPGDTADKPMQDMRALADEIAHHLDDRHRGERLRDGFAVAILGAPNAGKSSLLNALARRDAAIVSPVAGTTRDVIEAHLDLGGYPVTFADTAGLRESADIVENEGVRRALARAEQADLKLLVFDAQAWPNLDDATRALIDDDAIVVINKIDLRRDAILGLPAIPDPVKISAKTGAGVKELLDQLIDLIDLRFAGTSQPPLTRARHRAALEDCLNHLRRADSVPESELRAEDMRLAMRALGSVTGSVNVEELLDVIFRDFCIGK